MHAGADLVATDAPDAGDAAIFESVPNQCRPQSSRPISRVGRRDGGWRAADDGIVAIQNSLDLDQILLMRAAGVIAGKFPEGSLPGLLVRQNVPFDCHLRMGGA